MATSSVIELTFSKRTDPLTVTTSVAVEKLNLSKMAEKTLR
jgi:hypothetical protein